MTGVRQRIVKLVRDKVEQWLPSGEVSFQRVSHKRHVELLRAKLMEECVEYLLHPSVGELADVWEAVCALAVVDLELPLGIQAVWDVADAKREERGGFEGGTVMVATSVAPTTHEGEHAADDILGAEITTGCFGP